MTDEQFLFLAIHNHLPRWARARCEALIRRIHRNSARRARATADRLLASLAKKTDTKETT